MAFDCDTCKNAGCDACNAYMYMDRHDDGTTWLRKQNGIADQLPTGGSAGAYVTDETLHLP